MAANGADFPFMLRPPVDSDLAGVFELVSASDIREFGEPDYSLEEFTADWKGVDLARNARIAVESGGRIVGYATCNGEGEFSGIDTEGYVHPEREGDGIGTALVRWTEERAAEFVPVAPDGARVAIQNPTNAYNAEATALLTGLGYDLERQFWRMRIVLTGPPGVSAPPGGIIFRQVVDDVDERRVWEAAEESFADHWGHRARPFAEWAKPRKRHGHDPSLWWMALDGDEVVGTLVGYVMPGDEGWIKDVGVRPAWRRRGIAVAMLERSFGSFFARGVTSVALGVDSQNQTGATYLYERAGMSVVRGFAIFEKELRAGERIANEDADGE